LLLCFGVVQIEKRLRTPSESNELIRFENIFFGAHPGRIPCTKSKKRFPYFFPKSYPFSVWVNRRTDSLQLALYEQTKSISNSDIRNQLAPFMDGLARVFKSTRLPQKGNHHYF
jgi:hypothetical protein